MTEKAPEKGWVEEACKMFDAEAHDLGWGSHVYSKYLRDLTAERDALAAELRDARMSELAALGQAQEAYEQQQALAAEVERLREAILGATFMDSQKGTVHVAKQDWVDLAEIWPFLADVHRAALEEGKDG